MKLKIWCEHCNGIGNWFERKRTISGVEEIQCECMFCGGNGYTDPPQQILDDLELAAAVRSAFETGQHHLIQTYKGCRQAYFYDERMLIDWYREQKKGAE